jgi:hypothetical protein
VLRGGVDGFLQLARAGRRIVLPHRGSICGFAERRRNHERLGALCGLAGLVESAELHFTLIYI